MANEVEIRVTDVYRNGRGFSTALANARRLQTDLTRILGDAGSSGGETFSRNVEGRVRESRGRLTRVMSGAGGDSALGFVANLQTKIGPLLAKIPVSPHLAVAFAAATPLIGATVSAGVLLGLAGGTVAAGVAVAMRDPAVKAEAEDFGQFLSHVMSDAFSAFRPATIGALRFARGELGKMSDQLREIGTLGAGFVMPLTRGITNLVRNALPGIKSGLERAGPVVAVLEQGLGRVGTAAGNMIDTIAGGTVGAAAALRDLFSIASTGLEAMGRGVRFLTEAYAVMRYANDPVGYASEMAAGKLANAEFAGSVEELRNKLGSLGPAASGVAGSFNDLANAAFRADEAVEAFGDETLQAEQAALRAQTAQQSMTETIRENGRQTNVNSKRYIANKESLLNYAGAMRDSAAATRKQTGSQEAANAILAEGRRRFLAAAAAAGIDAKAAQNLANKLFAIPSPKPKISLNKQAAERALAQFNARANAAARPRTVWFYIKSSGDVRVSGGGRHLERSGSGYAHGGIVGAASGGIRSRQTLVGEQGPELVDLPPGSRVHTAGATKAKLLQASTGTAFTAAPAASSVVFSGDIHVHGVRNVEDLVEQLQRYAKRNGGLKIRVNPP
jgi:hypothetical protein